MPPGPLERSRRLHLDDLRDRPEEDAFQGRIERRGDGAAVGLKIVIIATMKPPIAEIGSRTSGNCAAAEAFHDQRAVNDRMASSRNVLPTVPCTVVTVLRVRRPRRPGRTRRTCPGRMRDCLKPLPNLLVPVARTEIQDAESNSRSRTSDPSRRQIARSYDRARTLRTHRSLFACRACHFPPDGLTTDAGIPGLARLDDSKPSSERA